MNNVILSTRNIDDFISDVANEVVKKIDLLQNQKKPQQLTVPKDSLDDLIPKSEVRGKLASSSSLWKWEKEGKIQSYGIGGKRFYKRSELMEALTKLKK